MVEVLIGTGNPSKMQRFAQLLAGTNARLITPADLHIAGEPEETGKTPLENAQIKAAFYGRYCERVVCNDSGLYFLDLPLDDSRQPGLHIRSPQGVRLDDEQMIAYYAALVHSLGGRVTASYLDAITTNLHGNIQGMMKEEYARKSAFVMLDAPHEKRHAGWPLDSLSITPETGRYFVEKPRVVVQEGYFADLRSFLCESLHLECQR